MKFLSTISLPLLVLALNGIASAHFVDASGVKVGTEAEVLKSGIGEEHVELRGNVLKKVGSQKYEFSDGTGTIRLEIDDEIFPREPIDDKTKVQISGEVEKEFMTSIEIDVKAIRRVD